MSTSSQEGKGYCFNPVDTTLNWITEELARLDQQSLKRSLRTVEQTEGAKITVAGQTLINFSSNNYLGLARDPRVIEAVTQVLGHWGVGATSSRLISGTSVIHEDLERALAGFLGREAALIFPTGYMANLALVSSLVAPGDAIVADRLCHASLIDAARLSGARLFVYEHANVEAAEKALQRATSYRRRLLMSDSLFSMDGDFAPVTRLAELAQQYGAMSLIDEAHAIGVWGEGGRGLTAGSEDRRNGGSAILSISDSPTPRPADPATFDVVVGTLSKSLGSQGGFFCASREIVDLVINRGRPFIFTTGLSPACISGAQAALSLVQEESDKRARVRTLSSQLRAGLHSLGFDTLKSESQIVPILLGEAADALRCAEFLRAKGIFAPAIRPPTVHRGECRVRFSVTAEHDEKDVERVLAALQDWNQKNNFAPLGGEAVRTPG